MFVVEFDKEEESCGSEYDFFWRKLSGTGIDLVPMYFGNDGLGVALVDVVGVVVVAAAAARDLLEMYGRRGGACCCSDDDGCEGSPCPLSTTSSCEACILDK